MNRNDKILLLLVLPRVLFELTDRDFGKLLTFKTEQSEVTRLILSTCKRYKFDGIVLEIWSTLSARVDDNHLLGLVLDIAQSLKYENLDLILVIPPTRRETVELFTPEHFEKLYPWVSAFSLMTYDYSSVSRPGANAPIYWVQNAIEYICPNTTQNVKEKRQKILMGLNFYGMDFTPDGGHPIVGHQYLDLLKSVRGRLRFDDQDIENYLEVK